MTQPFEGKSVLVTGGSRGIGRAIARRFAEEGAARVAIGYLRNDRAAEEAAGEIEARGADVTLVRGNVSSAKVAEQVAALGPLDVLVHNAATGVARPALETEDKHFDWTMSANARALIALARVAAPAMPGGSSIVALSSLGSGRVLDRRLRSPARGRRRGPSLPRRPPGPAPRPGRGRDADRSRLGAERLEVADVALVQLAVEGLLLAAAARAASVADRDAHVAEDRRAARRGRPRARPRATRSRAHAACSGVIQLRNTPSASAPASAHIFGPIAATAIRAVRRQRRRAAPSRPSRTTPSGRFVKPAPMPSHSRAGVDARPRRSSAAIVRRLVPVERQHGDADVRARGAAAANTAAVSRPLAIGWSLDHSEA